MTFLGVYERAVLSFLLWLTILAPRLLCSEFNVAYVTEHSLNICRCVRELPHCSEPDASECSCENHRPLPPRLAVWYSSPLHVALLLHNADVKHLSLVRCCCGLTPVPSGGISAMAADISTDMASGGNAAAAATTTAKMAPPPDHFVVQRLETLTVWPPADQPGSHHQVLLLGQELGAAHNEEPRIAVINTSILAGAPAPALKAYTVCTGLDAEGGLPFPNLPMLPRLRELVPDSSSIFVTFLY
ncbi:uncharacterized protein si:ch73-52p7.1 [Engraulis encrasicolus]|uniref:uncharacterized protein si:ch73-52p7.1 n=1 Tax=Engraulis encrasicolus TaxID=184585 RepID=UPI002FD13458